MKKRCSSGILGLILTVLLGLFMMSMVNAGSTNGFLARDDFEDGNAAGWTGKSGNWSVVNDNGSYVFYQSNISGGAALLGGLDWRDYTVEANVKVEVFGNANSANLCARMQDTRNYYAACLRGDGKLLIRKAFKGNLLTLAKKDYALKTGVNYRVRLEVNGVNLKLYLNDVLQLTATDSALAYGGIGLVASKTVAKYDNIVVSSTSRESGATATPVITPPPSSPAGEFTNIALKSSITGVQPMTGLVLWSNHEKANSEAIQLEYSYVGYRQVVKNSRTDYDWSVVETLLNSAKNHKHQTVLRFYDTYPGAGPDGNFAVKGQTAVPDYIKKLSNYKETSGTVEGEKCYFPDWSNAEYQAFVKEFFAAFAAKYDNDPRLAYLEVGFGLWAEYHIWEPGEKLGINFPSMEFQTQFVSIMQTNFRNLRWMVSIDAANTKNTPLVSLKNSADFGLFDDSFLQASHATENAVNFKAFGLDRYQKAPVGGEISYYNDNDQRNALSTNGPNGVSFATMASQFHISFMIGTDQPDYQTMDRIKQAGMVTGYKFKITSYKSSASQTRITVKNVGIAPLYYDAYLTVDGKKATTSLKLLQPGAEKEYQIDGPATSASAVAIQCNRLVAGQKIEFEANL